VSFLIVAVVYWLSLWRIIQGNRGNRVIECGGITLMLFFLMMLLMKLSNVPDWVLPSLGLLLLLLCLLTMFFLLLQAVQAIRHRKSKTALSSSSADNGRVKFPSPNIDLEKNMVATTVVIDFSAEQVAYALAQSRRQTRSDKTCRPALGATDSPARGKEGL
jgi:hypothetical protein